ncbi:hypothetical protein DSO57_1021402 [Entomophthora muscae]|uniref:Uncharacterized protein n=1 Tax=Entomophthora muscae TaxID=34485 RepID=A0ACC2TQD4_9FUNG|nr:hypothetical protein DSO57_1021402 [Entomophthora muscae]
MLEVAMQVILVLSLVANIIAVWVILRQNVRKIDLGLALLMAGCDLLAVVYKLAEMVYIAVTRDMRSKEDIEFGQWHGVLTTLTLHVSAMCVGYVALLRFWAIVLRRRVSPAKWWIMFVAPQLVMLTWLIAVAVQRNFASLQNRTLFFPNVDAKSWVVKACRTHLVITHFLAALAVNVSYPFIARTYKANLRLLQSGDTLHVQTRIVYTKIVGLVILYDMVILPVLIAMIIESFTGKLKSLFLEAFATTTLLGMTLVNPLVLLTLHHETQCEFKDLMKRLKTELISKGSQIFH